MKRVVVAIYIDPDFFPPTINAILNLADQMDEVVVISRNNSIEDYPYPSNVKLKKIGNKTSVRNMEKQPFWSKLFYFLKFTYTLHKHAKNRKADLVLLYDPYALLAFFFIKHVRHKKKVWYHNHDMPDKTIVRQYSIAALTTKYEAKAMEFIQFFSLPSKERLQYYSQLNPGIPVFIIPNYPSLKVYSQQQMKGFKKDIIRIIYQGFIGKGHGLEEIIELLKEPINGVKLHLVLKGSVTVEYRSFLDGLAKKFGVTDGLIWESIGPYSQMPLLTSSCDIGIGINENSDIISQTQGTASNKIYEYAASGLPVILNDSKQFTKYLKKYDWAFFTDGTVQSIKNNLESIIKDLPALNRSARFDFEKALNFENYFIPVTRAVLSSLN